MAKDGSVITVDIVGSLQEKLNENSFYGLVGGIVNALQTGANADNTALQDQLNLLQQNLATVQNEANVLGDAELKQVENALKATLTNLEANGFLGALCVTIGGQNFSLKDLVARMAQVDKVVETEKVWNADYTEIASVKFKLEDSSVITFTPSIVEDASSKNYTFSGNWKGSDVSFVANFAKVSRQTSVAGQMQTSIEYIPVKSSNIVFSLTSGLSNCVAVGVNDVVPDLNSDGVIGDAPTGGETTTPTPMSVSVSSVSVDAGSSATVTVSDAAGTVTAVSSDENVATVTVSGNDVTVTGVSAGTATVTISDGTTTINVTATINAVEGDGMVI